MRLNLFFQLSLNQKIVLNIIHIYFFLVLIIIVPDLYFLKTFYIYQNIYHNQERSIYY